MGYDPSRGPQSINFDPSPKNTKEHPLRAAGVLFLMRAMVPRHNGYLEGLISFP